MLLGEAAAGARECPSMTSIFPSARRRRRMVCPPRPDALGSQAQSAQAAAAPASIALPPSRRISSPASVASGNAVATAASPCLPPPGLRRSFVSKFSRPLTLCLGQIVQPVRITDAGTRKYFTDPLRTLALMIAHIDPVIFAHAQNFNLSRIMRHDVLERFLNAAEALIDALNDLNAAPQRDLKMRCSLHGSALEEVVRANANLVTFRKSGCHNIWIVVDLGKQHSLIEELYALRAHPANG